MAGVRRSRRLREAAHRRAAEGVAPEEWRDWAGLPEDVLAKVAGAFVAQTEAGWAAYLKTTPTEFPDFWTEEEIQKRMALRERDGNCCLFVFALVCKTWRKAQLEVGGPLRTRVESDVLLPGQVGLVKWALAEGCPREDDGNGFSMVYYAAGYGHLELVRWLCGEGGFAMDEEVMACAAVSGNLELVKWLRGEGCNWVWRTCRFAVENGHVEVLRWVRENGCEWDVETEERAAAELGYTDDFGNEL